MPLYEVAGKAPRVAEGVFIAPGAHVAGEVTIEEGASVWYGAVIRGDLAPVVIGPGSNIQDGAVVHVDHDRPVHIGAGVIVGHRAVVHGCTVRDGALIGMGAIVLNGAEVGEEAVVGAGALVAEGQVIPRRALALGVPARVVREIDDAMAARIRRGAETYRRLAAEHRAAAGREPGP